MAAREFLAAKAFFDSGRTLDVALRKRKLCALKNWIVANEARLEQALFADLGKSVHEAYMTEIGLVLSEISFVLKYLKTWTKRKKVKTPLALFPAKSYEIQRPYGPVLVLSPWNYPFLLSVEPVVSAIAAGNSVVLKPSVKSKNVSDLLVEMAKEVFPDSWMQVAQGGHELSDALVSDPFGLVFFTGSPRVGRHVMEIASKNLTPVVLELGGKSPCVVSKTADLSIAARRIAFGKLVNAGQTCVAPDFVVVDANVKEKFENLLVQEFKRYAPEGAKTEYLPKIIDGDHLARLQKLTQGETILCGGTSSGGKFAPTVLADVSFDSPVMQEEIFGPILPVISYESEDGMIDKLKSLPRPLAFYLFARDANLENRVLRELHFGGMTINDTLMHIASSELSFGGVGNSGTGRYHGEAGFKAFSHEESVLDRGIWLDLNFRYPPFDALKSRIVHFFLK